MRGILRSHRFSVFSRASATFSVIFSPNLPNRETTGPDSRILVKSNALVAAVRLGRGISSVGTGAEAGVLGVSVGTASPGCQPSEKYCAVAEDAHARDASKTVVSFMVEQEIGSSVQGPLQAIVWTGHA